ncbi:DUF3278 domain-containing protein [Vagococcus fluvialis]|uniref:DUF3278 domain-containing protein n=1 Tax=Vagococcus fluvialis TaxID=2738 RepID=UPI003B5ACC95
MEVKESITIKLIKHFYGVTGVIDEYRRGEIDKIGNKAFMLLYGYILLSTFIAILFIENNPKGALLALAGSNIVVFMGISGYIVWKTSRLKLIDIEVEEDKMKVTKRKLIIKNIGATIYFAIAIHFLNALSTIMMDGGSFVAELTSWNHIKSSLLSGVLFGVLMLIFSFIRLKKIEDE